MDQMDVSPIEASLLAMTADAVVGANPMVVAFVEQTVRPRLETAYGRQVYAILMKDMSVETSSTARQAAKKLLSWAWNNRHVHSANAVKRLYTDTQR